MRRAGALIATVGATTWAQALGGLLGGSPEVAGSLAVASVASAALVVSCWRTSRELQWASLGASALAALALGVSFGSWAAAGGLVVAVGVCTWLARRIAQRLPAALDAWPRRHRLASVAWLLLAFATVAQFGRLSSFMANPELDWFLTTTNAFWAKHECPYFQGA